MTRTVLVGQVWAVTRPPALSSPRKRFSVRVISSPTIRRLPEGSRSPSQLTRPVESSARWTTRRSRERFSRPSGSRE